MNQMGMIQQMLEQQKQNIQLYNHPPSISIPGLPDPQSAQQSSHVEPSQSQALSLHDSQLQSSSKAEQKLYPLNADRIVQQQHQSTPTVSQPISNFPLQLNNTQEAQQISPQLSHQQQGLTVNVDRLGSCVVETGLRRIRKNLRQHDLRNISENIKYKLDINKVQDRALELGYRMNQFKKPRELHFVRKLEAPDTISKRDQNTLNAASLDLNKLNNVNATAIRRAGSIMRRNFSRERMSTLNQDAPQDHESSRINNIGRIVKINNIIPNECSVNNYFSQRERPIYVSRQTQQTCLQNESTVSKNRNKQFSEQTINKQQLNKSSINSPYKQTNLSPPHLPPLPKNNFTIKKSNTNDQKQRQKLLLSKSIKANQAYHLKKFMTELVLSICDEAVERVQQKRTFFSYRFHRYNLQQSHRKSKKKIVSCTDSNNQERNEININSSLMYRLGEYIHTKHERNLQNANNIYYNTISSSRVGRSNVMLSSIGASSKAQPSTSNKQNQRKNGNMLYMHPAYSVTLTMGRNIEETTDITSLKEQGSKWIKKQKKEKINSEQQNKSDETDSIQSSNQNEKQNESSNEEDSNENNNKSSGNQSVEQENEGSVSESSKSEQKQSESQSETQNKQSVNQSSKEDQNITNRLGQHKVDDKFNKIKTKIENQNTTGLQPNILSGKTHEKLQNSATIEVRNRGKSNQRAKKQGKK